MNIINLELWGNGGIGRHRALKMLRESLGVRVPLPLPIIILT